uniref:Glucosidase n=1 Tax=Ophiorrhiza pumila TaxID=157934 RepID=A0A0A1HAP7_9GENT|nr:glucosidase [Ophiorrhiza pumila]
MEFLNPAFTRVPSGFLRRKDFGSDFIFGSATSAFQVEGGMREDGRGPSIWDSFAEKRNLFAPYSEDAINHHKNYEEDVKLMKEIGFDAYRFSISWTRILPTGKKESRNQKGIDFYKKLLKNLKIKGIEPYVTLLHFDPPQNLEDKYYGFLNRQIADDFCDYADICFKEFGNDVKHWITINEPWSFAYGGYFTGNLAPGYHAQTDKIAPHQSTKIPNDDDDDAHHKSSIFPPSRFSLPPSSSSASETPAIIPAKKLPYPDVNKYPYLVAHHQILAHAKAVKLYRQNYQRTQKGKIGIVLVSQWYISLDDDPDNKEATQRANDFMLGWFLDPIFSGDYPASMRKYVTKGYLPEFSSADKEMIKGSFDFLGLNYYTARYVTYEETGGGNYVLDQRARFHVKRKGKLIGDEKGASGWIYGYPRGMLDLLVYMKEKYNKPTIYITETGIDDPDDDSSTHWKSFYDQDRIMFYHDHLSYIKQAMRKGVNVKGFFAWSLMDNFEWDVGFKSRFGITYIDFEDGSKRCPKLSASWFKYFLEN